MKTFKDCKNLGSRLCDSFVKHLYEPIEGSSPIYYTGDDEAKAISVCNKCANYLEKEKLNNEHFQMNCPQRQITLHNRWVKSAPHIGCAERDMPPRRQQTSR